MKMRMLLALVVGKLLYLLGKPFGKATNLPGEIALKLCPDLLGRLRFKGKVLAVTGSNGKTTTANMVAHILKESGCSVTNNAKGSNLLGGVATTLLGSADFHGVVPEDYVVLEVDERFSRLIFRYFSPHLLLVTNLFRDQLTRNGNVDVIIQKLHEAIKPGVKLILNGNDPISGRLAPGNERVYYGMEKTERSTEQCFNITHDAKVCPVCFGRMGYSYFHYNHIGGFCCPSCGYTNPEWTYRADGVNFETGDFFINGIPARSDYRAAFHFLNMTAAAAACCELGLPLEQCVKGVSSFQVSRQRYDEFTVPAADGSDRKALMILSKNQNPVSFDQSIAYLLDLKEEKTVIVYVNNINHTNNKDTTWLYDISFERLAEDPSVTHMVCAGPRAWDLAVRLKLAGFDGSRVLVQTDLKKLKPDVAGTSGSICILTELYDANAILEVLR